MTPELWERLKPLFNAALEAPEGQRKAFIGEICGDDAELRQELNELVEAHDRQVSTQNNITVHIKNLITTTLPQFDPGEIVLGRFRIVRRLGAGGMGDVYQAIDIELSQTIALKTIRSEFVGDPGILARFKKEVQLARRISSANVCRIHELFLLSGDSRAYASAFLTMEYLDGILLADRVREGGPVPWREAQAILVDVCAGLSMIHDAGIIHRDLKCRNIMLVEREGARRAVLMDFGLAHELPLAASTAETGLTRPSTIAGTPEYMAPEQFEGKETSPATDIYAAGVVLYEIVTGKHPFAASSPLGAALLRAKRPDPIASLQKGVPHRWDLVIAKCLEYEATRRYQSARELAQAIENRVSLRGVLFRPSGSSRSVHAALLLAACLVLCATAVFVWRQFNNYHPPVPEARRWYEAGTERLREGAYLQATRALQRATQLDRRFGLAHARLADAWSELDFTGTAEHEMVLASAPEQEGNLPDLDRKYIEAVRATLIHDFPAAVQGYLKILHALPNDQKSYGYVDLGRAEEKAGRIADALKSYEAAAKLGPDNPAPFVHLGILESRRQDAEGAAAAFAQAESLYQSKSNTEGLAEVAFQRGHAANDRGDEVLAKASLEKCIELSDQIPSPQMEIRALTQLSTVEYYSDQDDAAIADAEQAIQKAQDNNLEYWATDGLIREANAYLDKMDLTSAEKVLEKAIQQAASNQHPRLEANARLTLASVRDKQGRRDEQIELAQQAMRYYQEYGFLTQASQATDLFVRALEGKGKFAQALQPGKDLLELARKSAIPVDVESAHETLGGVLLGMQRYPEALAHFQEALGLSKATHENEAYQLLHCAEALWHLGRYSEAEAMLSFIPVKKRKQPDIALAVDRMSAEMLLSQRHFSQALRLASEAAKAYPSAAPLERFQLKRVEVLADAELGRDKDAQRNVNELVRLAQSESNEELFAQANLVQAVVYLRSHMPERAETFSELAERYFNQAGEVESQWLSLAYLALASKGDPPSYAERATEALDTLSSIEHTWKPEDYRQYCSRPDVQATLQALPRLKRS